MEKITQNFTGWTVNNNSSLQITFSHIWLDRNFDLTEFTEAALNHLFLT